MISQCQLDGTWTQSKPGRTGSVCVFCARRVLNGLAMMAMQAQVQTRARTEQAQAAAAAARAQAPQPGRGIPRPSFSLVRGRGIPRQ